MKDGLEDTNAVVTTVIFGIGFLGLCFLLLIVLLISVGAGILVACFEKFDDATKRFKEKFRARR